MKQGLLRRWMQFAFPSQYNDWILRPQRLQYEGMQPKADKIAIFLIFPTHGVQSSHLHSLRYMVENGYSPLVVSNLPLSVDDIAQIGPLAWRIIQRQNFGYDFGGYRDAVLDLAAQLPLLKRLVFLNDSCWFPLAHRKNWLQHAEQSGYELFGAEQHRSVAPYRATGQWRTDPRHRRLFYASFALSIGPNILQHPSHLQFWKRLRLSDGKGRTIRRAEHGYSFWLRRQGFSHGALSTSLNMDQVLGQMSDVAFDRLWVMRRAGDATQKPHDAPPNTLQPHDDTLRSARTAVLLASIANTGIATVLPHFAISDENYPFLKKSATAQNVPMLRKIILDLGDPNSKDMLQELDQRISPPA